MKGKKILKKLVSIMIIMALTFNFTTRIINIHTKEAFAATKSKLTYENFCKIRMSSTYSDVVKLIGNGKKEDSSSSEGSINMEIYNWDTRNNGKVTLVFTNLSLVSKTQYGLCKESADITYPKYLKLKKGITYSEAVSILGQGVLYSETVMSHITITDYEWTGSDGTSFVNCCFQNGALISMSENGLSPRSNAHKAALKSDLRPLLISMISGALTTILFYKINAEGQ